MNCSRKPLHEARLKSKSTRSTDTSSSLTSIDSEPRAPPSSKLKTELCKTFSMMGYCPYGRRCRFAHGRQELVVVHPPNSKKQTLCKSFWNRGVCNYGTRCQFGHAEVQWQGRVALVGKRKMDGQDGESRLMKILRCDI